MLFTVGWRKVILMNIDHRGIVVRDLDIAREFFATLGFTVVRGGHLEDVQR